MSGPSLRIGFMGTPEFAVPALHALQKAGHEIVCVYTQPPRPKGRGHKVQNSPVHVYADTQNVPVFHPENFKDVQAVKEWQGHDLDVAVVAAYGLILPKAVLDAPKYGCLNIHASLLPRWRGASPIQRAIWAGDLESGVTIMQMDEGLDTGPMIVKKAVNLDGETTASSLHDDLAKIGGELIVEVMGTLAAGKALKGEKQDDALSTYAPLLTKEDGRVDWSQSNIEIDRQVRALNPWPGVWTERKHKRLKILEAKFVNTSTNSEPAKVLNLKGEIACGRNSILKLMTVQPEGAKAMDIQSAVNGHYLETGDELK